MFSQLQNLPSRTARSLWSTHRNISRSPVLCRSAVRDPRFREFLEGPGSTFKNPQPQNWLGGEVPFPMNPSFVPPIPIADKLRTKLYDEYMADPLKNSVRELARKYHLSLKRVDAILRLKGHENAWIKKKPLQTGFLAGMEELLGVKRNRELRQDTSDEQCDPVRHDVSEADALEEEEKRDRARQKYQRMFWEAIPEGGQEPIMPGLLKEARNGDRQTAKVAKSHSGVVPRSKDRVVVVEKLGRPTMTFIDVGGRFIDSNDQSRRVAGSERRKRIKARHLEDKARVRSAN